MVWHSPLSIPTPGEPVSNNIRGLLLFLTALQQSDDLACVSSVLTSVRTQIDVSLQQWQQYLNGPIGVNEAKPFLGDH